MPTEEEKNKWIKFLEQKEKEHPYFLCKNQIRALEKNPCNEQCGYCKHLYRAERGQF